MRELAYKEEYHLDFVIASRRMLTEICKLAVKACQHPVHISLHQHIHPIGQPSGIFQNAFFLLFRKSNPVWNKTERGMRSVFTRMMFKKYGKNWLRELKNKYGEQESLKFAESERRLGNLRRMMQAGRQTTEVTLTNCIFLP